MLSYLQREADGLEGVLTMSARRDHTPAVDRLPVLAAVMAGGKSRRMGVDKRTLTVGGQSMLSRVVGLVTQVCERTVIVVARDEDRLSGSDFGPGTRVIHDLIPDLGPLGGLITALSEPDAEWVLAVGADMPLIQPEIVRLLWARRPEWGAVVAVGPRGREPLLALYHVRCREAALSMAGSLCASPMRLFDLVPTTEVAADELRTVDAELLSLLNVNTPSQYQRVAVGTADADKPLVMRVDADG